MYEQIFDQKLAISQEGVRIPKGFDFNNSQELNEDEILTTLGDDLIIKPTDQEGKQCFAVPYLWRKQLVQRLQNLDAGNWLIEKRVFGFGVSWRLGAKRGTLGVVEVISVGGV